MEMTRSAYDDLPPNSLHPNENSNLKPAGVGGLLHLQAVLANCACSKLTKFSLRTTCPKK